jgi:hypothetical protein
VWVGSVPSSMAAAVVGEQTRPQAEDEDHRQIPSQQHHHAEQRVVEGGIRNDARERTAVAVSR